MSSNSKSEIKIPALSGKVEDFMQHLSDAFGGMSKCWEMMEIEVSGEITEGMTLSWKHATEHTMRLKIIKAIGELTPLYEIDAASLAAERTAFATRRFENALTNLLEAHYNVGEVNILTRLNLEREIATSTVDELEL